MRPWTRTFSAAARSMHAPVAAGDDLRLVALQPQRRLHARTIDGACEARDVGRDRGLVDPARGDDLTAEDAHAEALEAPERPEPLTLTLRGLDRGAPVDVDDDRIRPHAPALALGGEHRGVVRELAGLALEERPRLAARQAGDVDACDLRAGGQALGRAREREPENGAAEQEQPNHEQAPLPEEPNPGTPAPTGTRKLCCPHRQVDQCIDGEGRFNPAGRRFPARSRGVGSGTSPRRSGTASRRASASRPGTPSCTRSRRRSAPRRS